MPRFGKFYPQSKWVIGSLALGLSAISGSTIADSGTAPDKQSKQQDAAGNMKPSKSKSTSRIDGIAATLMS